MEEPTAGLGHLAANSKDLARRLVTIAENRVELLTVEVQEAREKLLHAILLGFGIATFGLLAGLALTAAIVVWLWAYSPVVVLLIMTGIYGLAGIWLWTRLNRLLRDWETLSASLDQLRKDRACLEKILG